MKGKQAFVAGACSWLSALTFFAATWCPHQQAEAAPISSAKAIAPNLTISPMPVISRGAPAFASDGNAADANSLDYGNAWCAKTQPAWIAYDLSSLPVSQRTQILAYFWINGTSTYDAKIIKAKMYDAPGPFVIEGNRSAGGRSAPVDNWVKLVTGPDPMTYKARQYLIDFSGYNWIRLRTLRADLDYGVRASCCLKFDIYDVSKGVSDDWLLLGDSVSSEAWHLRNPLPTLIHQRMSAYFPIAVGAGIPFMSAGSVIQYLPEWLHDFPGRFVSLAYGTNDVNNLDFAAEPARLKAVVDNFAALVKLIVAAGKVPIIPAVIWRANNPTAQNNLKLLNAKLGVVGPDRAPANGSLRSQFPQIVVGPDLYQAFEGHPEWYYPDGMHPNDEGNLHYQKVWADWAIKTFYQPR